MSSLGLALGLPFGRGQSTGGAVDPGLALLQSATLWLDASNPGADSQKLANRGTGGSVLDARFGSTTGVDTNDPLLLTHTGTNYLYLPGISGNYCTVPDSAALGITGDIDLRVRVSLADWTPTTDMGFITKDSSGREYAFGVNATAGTLYLYWWNSGATFTQVNSSVAPTVTDGGELDVRATLDVDNGASGRDVKFWTKSVATPLSDNSGWTQLGTTSTAAGVSSIRDTADLVGIGGRDGGNFLNGSVYRAMILNGIDGTTVFDADFTANSNQSSFTESSSNAATVTINRTTSGRKSVMVVRPTLLFGTDDYLEVADNDLLDFAAGESLSVVAVMRQHATPPNFAVVAYKVLSAGYIVQNNGTAQGMSVLVNDGTYVPNTTSGNPSAGSRKMMALIRDVVADQVLAYNGSTAGTPATDTTTATLANTGSLFVGAYNDMELDTLVVFRSALTSIELGQIATYLGI